MALIILEVFPLPSLSKALIAKMLASGAIPVYLPLEEYPLPAIIPDT